MACEGSKTALVYFQYEGEGERVIKSYSPPVSYALTPIPPKPGEQFGVYNFTYGGAYTETIAFPCNSDKFTNQISSDITGRILDWWCQPWQIDTTISATIWQDVIEANSPTGKATCSIARFTRDNKPAYNATHWYYCKVEDANGHISIRTINANRYHVQARIFPPVSKTIQEPGTGSQCKFEAFESKGIIYTETRETCPIVRIECEEECPPETCCECICNGYKCCYGNEGKAIKRIKL